MVDFVFVVVVDSDGRRWRRASGDTISDGGWGRVCAKETDVENRVDVQRRGQLELVCDRGDLGTDGVGTDEAGLEFPCGALCLGGEVDVRRREEYLVSYSKGDITTVLVSILLLVGLGQYE